MLEPERSSFGIKVRVIRCYRQPSSHKADPDGTLELILHDEIGDRIHATMDYGVFKDKKLDIIEGNLYKFMTFMVAHDMSKYRTTTNPFKLRLYNSTSITPFQDSDFPSSMYNFRDLFEIVNDIAVQSFQLLDVIGRVVSYQKPTFVAKLSTNRMDFKIANTQGRELGCSLWSEYIDPVLEIFEKDDPRPIIICIQFGKITRIFDEIKVSNTFHVTKVTVNGETDVFKNFLDGMVPDAAGNQNNGIAEEFHDIYALFKNNAAQMSDISILTKVTETKNYWIDATIFSVETKGECWYRSCWKCFKKMPMDERNRKCFICGYKIEVMVAGIGGCAALMMWDTNCNTLIGKSAKQMKQLNDKAGTVIPRELKEALVDKRVLFEVKCPANKVNKDVPQFTVNRVAVDEDIFHIYAANYTPTKGSTTGSKNKLHEMDDDASSMLLKGKEKMDIDDKFEDESDVEEGIQLGKGKKVVNCEEKLEDEKEESVDGVTLRDLKEKKISGGDAKYSSKNKKMRLKHDK
ncbi:hypothetical protein CASFOL_040082 [Castilleja foliolosa]|uniref:Replication protein A 70 kDa DNA-binding subunit B/D first OB fold domain-containing protein n=1 Tax=Castilleja foliolosa TaxID=1961234 RepID=A0ABD3BEF3_9LAMI